MDYENIRQRQTEGGKQMDASFDFDAFLTHEAEKLVNYCAAIVGSSDAEDVAQEAFLRLWQNLSRITDERAACAFLYRTAYRLGIDVLRKRKRFQEPEVTESGSDALSDRMITALMQLKPEDRVILYCRAVEELEYADLAARFGKNETWARKRYSLAKARLAKLLRPAGEEK